MTTPAPSRGPAPLRVGGLALLAIGALAGLIGLWSLAGDDGGGDPSAAPPPGGDPSVTAPEQPGQFTPEDGIPPGPEAPAPGAPGAEAPGAGDGQPGGPAAGPGGEDGVPVPSFPPGGPPADGSGADGTGAGADGTGTGTGTGGDGTGTGTDGTGSDGTGANGGPAAADGADAGAAVRMPLRVYNNSTIPGLAARGKADFEAAGWTVTDTGGYNGRIPLSTVYYRPGTAEEEAAQYLASTFGLRASERFAGLEDSSPGVIVILTRDYQGEDKAG